MHPHVDTAGSGDGTQAGPKVLAAHSAAAWHPQTFCDVPCSQYRPRGLAVQSPSPVHWHDPFAQCGPNVLFAQSVSTRHGTQVWSDVSHAAMSGSVQSALEKQAPQVPVLGSQCFAEGVVQSVSAPHPQLWVPATQAGPLAFPSQSPL
jgi:hypothetical protein